MRQHTIWAATALLGFGALGGCLGKSGGSAIGSGSGGTTGPTTGTGGSSGTGGSTSAGAPGELNLDGSPQYFRMVRLTNAQWARAGQDGAQGV